MTPATHEKYLKNAQNGQPLLPVLMLRPSSAQCWQLFSPHLFFLDCFDLSLLISSFPLNLTSSSSFDLFLLIFLGCFVLPWIVSSFLGLFLPFLGLFCNFFDYCVISWVVLVVFPFRFFCHFLDCFLGCFLISWGFFSFLGLFLHFLGCFDNFLVAFVLSWVA